MARKDKKKKNKQGNEEDYFENRKIRNSMRKPSKTKRKKDKKYLSDVLRGDIDTDSYHDYNDV